MVEFSFNAQLTPVNPESNDVVAAASRNKRIVFSEVRQIDTKVLQKNGVEYSLRAIDTGSRSVPTVYIAENAPIFGIDGFLGYLWLMELYLPKSSEAGIEALQM